MMASVALLAAAISVSAPFDKKGGHIQGMCAGGGHYYLSQMTRLYKIDKTGACVKSVPVVSHTGDICYRDGRIYTAVAVYGGPEKGKGKVQVFDTDLNLVREATYDRGLDGITFFNGAIYAGRGSHRETVPHKEGVEPQSKTPHLDNEMVVLDSETLQVKKLLVFSHGSKTHYGVQNATSDGKVLYATFYPAEGGAPDLVAFDAEMRPQRGYRVRSSTGFECVPSEDGALRFVRCVSGGGKGKPITATIEDVDLKSARSMSLAR